MTKLIIVEGLPGSGKSTTANMVYDLLKEKGINAEIYREGDYNHIADYDGVAYFNNEQFNLLSEKHPNKLEMLNKIKVKYFDGYLIPFKKALNENTLSFEDEIFNDIVKNDIYELPMDIHIKLIFDRWDSFVNGYKDQDKVIVFECCFIQNPVTVSMIRNNSPKDVTMSYIHGLAKKIVPLEPMLIYVKQKDIKASFCKAVNERDKDWFEGFKYYYTEQGYGAHNNLNGLNGVLQVLEARSELENEIYDSLKFTKHMVDNSLFDSDLLKDKIRFIIEDNL